MNSLVFLLELAEVDQLLLPLDAGHDLARTIDQYEQHVTLLDLHVLRLLILGRDGEHTSKARIDVHGSGHEEENKQQEKRYRPSNRH